MSTAGKMVSGLGIIVAGAATKMAYDFDKAFTRIAAISNASTQDIEQWRSEVLDMAGATAQAPQELADALFFLASAGLETSQVMETLNASAKASAVGLGETTDIAKITANALNAYAESGLTAAQVTDTLVAAVREGSAEPEEFAAALGRILPIAAQAGVEFDEITASLAALSNIGLDVNEGVTAMRGLLGALVAPGTQAAKTLAEVGISADQMRKVISEEGILGALRLLEERTGGNIDTMRKIVPNIRALTGAFGLTVQEAEKVNDIFAAVKDSTGSLNDAFEETADTAAFRMDAAMNDLKVTMTELGATVLPTASSALGTFVTGLQEWAAILGLGPGLEEVMTTAQGLTDAWRDGAITATELDAALQHLSTTSHTEVELSEELRNEVDAAVEAEKREIDIRKSAEAGLQSYMNVLDNLSDAYTDVVDATEEAADAGRRLPKELREALVSELPAIVGTVVKYKDAFSLSPAELVKITATWARIGRTMADDLRAILNSDLKPELRAGIAALPPEMRHAWVEGNRSQRAPIEASVRETFRLEGVIDEIVSGFREAGANAVQGFINGIDANRFRAAAAAANMAREALDAANRALGEASPSREFHRTGYNAVVGFVNGVNAGRPLAARVTEAWINDLIKIAETRLREVTRIFEKRLEEARQRLQAEVDRASEFRGSITGGFSDLLDIAGGIQSAAQAAQQAEIEALQTQLEAAKEANNQQEIDRLEMLIEQARDVLPIVVGGDLSTFAAQAVATAQQFADVLQAAAIQGLNPDLIAQFAEQGPSGIPQLQAILQAGPDVIAQLNEAFETISGLSKGTAKALSEQFFGQKIDDLRDRVREIHETMKERLKAINDALRDLNKLLTNAQNNPPDENGDRTPGHPRPEVAARSLRDLGSGSTVNITVNGWVGNDQDIAARLDEEMRRSSQRGRLAHH